MKRLITLAFFSLVLVFTHAQDIKLYGFLPSAPDPDFLRLGHLDPLTGNIVDEDSIYPATAYALGSSTFDAVNNAYMFIGVDTSFNFRLYTRGIRSTTLYDPIFNETINDLQYDMNSMGTYGMGNYIKDSILIDSISNWWEYTYATRFLEIDQDSGYITELTLLPDITAFPVGSSTFDANGGRYIVNAYDTSFVERMVIIEAETGTVLSKDPIGLNPGDYLNNLQYNNEDDKIYGFYRGSNNTYYALISIDLENNYAVDTIYTFTDLLYFTQGGAVLHQSQQYYIMFYVDNSNVSRIAVIDITSGERIANPSFSGNFLSELQIDDTDYALAKYHAVAIDEKLPESAYAIFPNPLDRTNQLKFRGNVVPDEVNIYDITGKLWYTSPSVNQISNSISIENLVPGIYIVAFTRSGKTESHKLLVR